MQLSVLKPLLARYGITPFKEKGQHFLCHLPTLDRLQALVTEKEVLEIGPGPGSLTARLYQECNRTLVLIEKDPRFSTLLGERFPKSRVILGDALELPWWDYTGFTIVSNLPYYVSVPIVLGYLRYSPILGKGIFMMQKEVAKRMIAKPSTHFYGRLSVMAQTYATPTWIMDVSPSAFWPMPSVDSAVLLFTPSLRKAAVPFHTLEKVVAMAFRNRRKMLHHPFQSWGPELWSACDLDPSRRGETLSVEEFTRLSLALLQIGGIKKCGIE